MLTADQRTLLDTLADQVARLPGEAAGYLRERLASQHSIHLARPWLKKEDLFLIDHYQRLGCDACAEKLGRTGAAVYHRVRELRLVGEPWWSEDEEQHIRDHYKHDGPKTTAEELGRTVSSVTAKAFRMGIKFSLAEKIRIARGLHDAGYCDTHIGESMGYSRAWWYPHRTKAGLMVANGRWKCPLCRSQAGQNREQSENSESKGSEHASDD